LHHWDYPQTLYENGGWTNRENLHAFADFAAIMVKRLGDRVTKWATFNEPGVIAWDGYVSGEHAPGIKNDLVAARQVTHNLLVAHGLAVQSIRAVNPNLDVGIVLSQWGVDPASDDPADIAAADRVWNAGETAFLHPIFMGHYHPAMIDAIEGPLLDIKPGDFSLISQKLDFLGINSYSRSVISAKDGRLEHVPGSKYTDMGWEVCAPAFRRMLVKIHSDYRLPPIYITENGAAFPDMVSLDGKIHDQQRLEYLQNHFIQVHLAMQDGVDVRGYFVWSLLDNFEWGHGFTKRFGIVRVDYETQKRTIKDSGEWYSRVISSNQVVEE
jgi:beta-glucosidase